jgi:beta-lactamase regulating signal transducer with metallopeptidase domain
MDLYSLATNTGSAELILNLSLQLITVSLIGWAIMKIWRPRSAPARSAWFLTILISMAVLPVFTVMLSINRITLFKTIIELPLSYVSQLPLPFNKTGIPDNNNDEMADSLYEETDHLFALPDQNIAHETESPDEIASPFKEQHETLHLMYDETVSTPLTHNRILVPGTENQQEIHATSNKQDQIPVEPYEKSWSSFFSRDRVLIAINIFGGIWIAGFIVFILRLGFKLSFLKGYMHNLCADNNERLKNIYNSIKPMFNGRPMPEIYFSATLSSPVTVGIFKTVMILPVEMEDITDDELKSILLHELAHIFHHDNFIGLLQHVLSSIFWWNPFVHFLNAAYSDSREDVCDNYALKFLKNPKIYANTLVSLAEKTFLLSRMPATAGISLSRRSLEYRVLDILKPDRDLSTIHRPSIIILSLILAMVISSCGTGLKLTFKEPVKPEHADLSRNAGTDYRIDSSPGAGWTEQTRLNDMTFLLPDKASMIYVGRIPISIKNKEWHPEEIYMTWISGMQKKYQLGDISIESSGATTLDGRESYYAIYEFGHGYVIKKEKVYFIRGESTFYRIRYSCPKVNYTENLETFERYVKSFKVGT